MIFDVEAIKEIVNIVAFLNKGNGRLKTALLLYFCKSEHSYILDFQEHRHKSI